MCTGVTINKTAKFSVKVQVTECTEELAAGPRVLVCPSFSLLKNLQWNPSNQEPNGIDMDLGFFISGVNSMHATVLGGRKGVLISEVSLLDLILIIIRGGER